MNVQNMDSDSSGRAVANQFIITDDKGRYFQSWRTFIAFKPFFSGCVADDRTQLDRDKWDYSTTTGRYRNQFLGEKKKETLAKIKSGEYILADLNK